MKLKKLKIKLDAFDIPYEVFSFTHIESVILFRTQGIQFTGTIRNKRVSSLNLETANKKLLKEIKELLTNKN